jgi:hypothetical protein
MVALLNMGALNPALAGDIRLALAQECFDLSLDLDRYLIPLNE